MPQGLPPLLLVGLAILGAASPADSAGAVCLDEALVPVTGDFPDATPVPLVAPLLPCATGHVGSASDVDQFQLVGFQGAVHVLDGCITHLIVTVSALYFAELCVGESLGFPIADTGGSSAPYALVVLTFGPGQYQLDVGL